MLSAPIAPLIAATAGDMFMLLVVSLLVAIGIMMSWTVVGRLAHWLGFANLPSMILWCFLGLATVGLIPFVLSYPLQGAAWMTILVPMFIVTLWVAIARHRQTQAMEVVGYLTKAIRMNLPIPQVLIAAAETERGFVRRRLMYLAGALEEGLSLGFTLHAYLPELPSRIQGELTVADRMGRLPALIDRLDARNLVDRMRTAHSNVSPATALIYPIGLLLSVVVATTLLIQYVLPTFAEVLTDSGTYESTLDQHPFISWLFTIGHTSTLSLLTICGIIAALVCVILPGHIARVGLGRRWPRLESVTWIGDWITWHTPFIRNMIVSRSMGMIGYVLAEGCVMGMPIWRAIDEASHLSINQRMKKRLQHWSTRIKQGIDVVQAAKQAKMPDIVVSMMASNPSGKSMEQTFTYLARYYDSKFHRASLVLTWIIWPLCIALSSVIVMWVCLSVVYMSLSVVNDLMVPAPGM